MRATILALLLSGTSPALSDVQITSPAAGASLSPGKLIIAWKESGVAPAISQLKDYTIQLCTGGNTEGDFVSTRGCLISGGYVLMKRPQLPIADMTSAPIAFSGGSSYTATIPTGRAADLTNGFFLRMQSNALAGGYVVNFSNRFSMTGLGGTTDSKYELAVQNLNGASKGPDTINQVANNANAGAPAAAGGAYAIPYTLQTGLTKYAPMQPIPGTKITRESFTPLFPTSAYTLATTIMARPTILTTLTAQQTFSVSSIENPASPQSQPADDMAKFLARWKD